MREKPTKALIEAISIVFIISWYFKSMNVIYQRHNNVFLVCKMFSLNPFLSNVPFCQILVLIIFVLSLFLQFGFCSHLLSVFGIKSSYFAIISIDSLDHAQNSLKPLKSLQHHCKMSIFVIKTAGLLRNDVTLSPTLKSVKFVSHWYIRVSILPIPIP